MWILTVVLVVVVILIFPRFTLVKEGTAKIVMQFGAFHRVLLAKKGYTLNADGDIVPGHRQQVLPGGLRFVGIWWIHTIYKRDQNWIKSLPDGIFQPRSELNVDFILAKVDYPYGLEIKKAESKDLLSLDAKITLTSRIVNPYKAQFAVNDWFNVMVGRIAPSVREYISNYTYEEIINGKDTTSGLDIKLDHDVMAKLSTPGANGSDSIIDILKNAYGIEVSALETVDINPDESYRKATLAKWQAEREAEAELAKQEIGVRSFTAETSGREISMIAKWLGISVEALQKDLRDAITADNDHGFENWLKKYPVVARNWNLIQQKQLGVKPNLFGNADGSALDPLVTTLAALLTVARGTSSGGKSGSSENPSKGRGKKKKPEDMDDDEAMDSAFEED